MAKLIQSNGELFRAMELANGGLAPVSSSDFQRKTVTIAGSASESDELDCGEGMRLVGYEIGTALISTSMTYKVGSVTGSRLALYNDAGAVSHTVAASKAVSLPPADFYPWRYVSFVAGTVQGAVAGTINAILASL